MSFKCYPLQSKKEENLLVNIMNHPIKTTRASRDNGDRLDQNRNMFDSNNICCDFSLENGHVSSVCGKPMLI